MASFKPPPTLPQGPEISILSGLSETFAFHSSPESFISSRIQALQSQSQIQLTASPQVVRARILNRNVAVVTTHAHILHILQSVDETHDVDDPPYEASSAYGELMAPFFPSPNLLLTDGDAHKCMRADWENRFSGMMGKVRPQVTEIVQDFMSTEFTDGKIVDVYQSLKRLSWKILLGVFLGLQEGDAEFIKIEMLQEELLRGQFSLFPVSVTTPFWKSPRSKGISAKEELQKVILRCITKSTSQCPFQQQKQGIKLGRDGNELAQMVNHILLFTSSLSVKALSSLLTAFVLNLMLFEADAASLRIRIQKSQSTDREKLLSSILKETERLCPPVVGIMRRSMRDNIVPSPGDAADTLIPKGWDVWLYFMGPGRDASAFGPDCNKFIPDRWINHENSTLAMTFSTGPKSCLGQGFVRDIALAVGNAFCDTEIKFIGDIQAKGVRAWLGWDNGNAAIADWSKDMKQLPTQRPAKPILVQVSLES
jgi:cytochrome P450